MIALLAQAQNVSPEVHISTTTRVFAVVVAALFLILVLEMIRRRVLRERYSVVWFGAGLALMTLALVPSALESIADVAGIADPNATLFAAALAMSGLLLLNLSAVVSRQDDRITRLAQEVALLRSRLGNDDERSGD
jgi:hypothetical protein